MVVAVLECASEAISASMYVARPVDNHIQRVDCCPQHTHTPISLRNALGQSLSKRQASP
jgi:hypothetical protein